jgi:hypothetical protein
MAEFLSDANKLKQQIKRPSKMYNCENKTSPANNNTQSKQMFIVFLAVH